MELTKREREIAQKLVLGLGNKQIAFEMGLSPSTVKIYVYNLTHKLHLNNRTQVAVWASNGFKGSSN